MQKRNEYQTEVQRAVHNSLKHSLNRKGMELSQYRWQMTSAKQSLANLQKQIDVATEEARLIQAAIDDVIQRNIAKQ